MKETIVQFGSGNFLRGFFCQFIHQLNEKGLYDGKIVVVQPTPNGKTSLLNAQNAKYNLILRGIESGKEKCEHIEINSVSRGINPYVDYDEYLRLAENENLRFIVSNTTEAGIAFDESCRFSDHPALSFPGKLTQLLYHRYRKQLPGFVILPCELIDNNADALLSCVLQYADLWNLGEDFVAWVKTENCFCNTLVDRIVSGYPTDEAQQLFEKIGYEDQLLDTAELYHLWVIEGNFEKELPLQKAGINCIWTDDVKPFKKMKVRILNGAHTALVFASLLCGIESVGDSMRDELLHSFLHTCLFDYILPTVGNDEANLNFAKAVLERFANPYIRHLWKSISLNSVSKFCVRVLPTIFEYIEQNNALPKPLVFALACLIVYYKTNDVQDAQVAVDYIKQNMVADILSNTALWGKDLSFMTELVTQSIEKIQISCIREAIKWTMS